MTRTTDAAQVAVPDFLVDPLVRAALAEDLGRAGDVTSNAVVPADASVSAEFVARRPGVVAGTAVAALAFRIFDPSVICSIVMGDGSRVAEGDCILTVSGNARSILAVERAALNFLCRLSGIATATAKVVAAIEGTGAVVTCTRKTTPTLRALEKAAVRAGGGSSHRFGLDDAVLIKDNHVALAGGVSEAIRRARRSIGHMIIIEVEVDTLDQLREAMTCEPDVVLLDNMTVEQLRQAVSIVNGRAVTEASGRIDKTTAAAIAATGVDVLSVGWLTHSAPILDIALDVVDRPAE